LSPEGLKIVTGDGKTPTGQGVDGCLRHTGELLDETALAGEMGSGKAPISLDFCMSMTSII
jgi:hypothetical protein